MSGADTLRPGDGADLPAAAEVLLRARRAASPAMPPLVHPDAEVRAHLVATDLEQLDLWVGEVDGVVVAYALLGEAWLDDLYVDPAHQGQGIGGALLAVVQALRPAGFGLWVFAGNVAARRFYRRHGLVEVRATDGSGNQEREPDVELWWPGSPVAPGPSPGRGRLG